ncbi:hypothetical protein [Streptomyces sp. NPDC088812]|uniref:hypothetical protein n=1 Tax=Streptomyces sp. NPDC088812 TaxID=3365905 RepID=UPI00380CF0B6
MKIQTKRLGAVLATAMAAVGITTAVTAPAQAAGTATYYAVAYDPTYPSLKIADALFTSSNDTFNVWDDMLDGHGTVLHINLSDDAGATYHRWKNLYIDTDLAYEDWNFDDEFSEGRYFAFRVCRQDGINQEAYHCGDWVKGTA